MTQTQKCHFIGIGGIGMSGLARILLSKNSEVSGSDLATTYVTEGLVQAGAKISFEHSPQNVSPDMTVIYTSDIKQDNPEYQAALKLKCAMLHRSDLLVELMRDYKTLAVAGTHGKTTTTALLTAVLFEGKFDPAYAVGGMLPQFQANGGYGTGDYFVAEADESDGTFLKYSPYGAIVTNIDNDHMDYYKSDANLESAFQMFFAKVESPTHLFWCGDDPWLKKIAPKGISYGFGEDCQLRISHFYQDGWNLRYDLEFKGKHYKKIEVALTGRHNALNSAAVFGLALCLGVKEEAIRKALKEFCGVMRRCEKKGEAQGVLILDDYAHHPTELRATLLALREAVQERRLIAVYQPHRYTRTKECLGHFAKVFDAADLVIVTEIFGARETPIPGLSSDQIVEEVRQTSRVPCLSIPRAEVVHALGELLRSHDVVVSLGAGDITKLGKELLAHLKIHPPKKIHVGVVFGGQSVEHEISISSARHVIRSLNPVYYEVSQFGISREGEWIAHPGDVFTLTHVASSKKNPEILSGEAVAKLSCCDVIFPVLHGTYGEDGTIQGFFEILNKGYVSCDYQSAAVCMDKALTKKLMLLNGLATSPFVDFGARDWKNNREALLSQIETQLTYPVFVKPVHLGSSVAITKVIKPEDLEAAIELAFAYDRHVLVENGIQGRELEFAVYGNTWVVAFPPGEILANGIVYDYDAKYGPDSTPTTPAAELSQEAIEEGCYLAETAYKAAGCSGMARVDFFYEPSGKYWLNEINPIPGFTPISLFPQICAAQGIAGPELMDKLLILALHRQREKLLKEMR